jgi:hydroxyacylglutathione hydrolase
MRFLIAFTLLLLAAPTWSDPVPGSMAVHWNEGAADCKRNPQPQLQVHRYEPQTYILRQSPCADAEANFMYLLIGSQKALLIDTGAVSDPGQMPLARTVMQLLSTQARTTLPLLVVHTHAHRDHRAGDAQFTSLASVQVVSPELADVRKFFGFSDWPNGVAGLDLGGRSVEVLPAPGHESAHLVFYDDRTASLFTGDFLLPGRLIIDDLANYRSSAARLVAYVASRPVTHIFGGHIEVDANGEPYAMGSTHHPNEHALELARPDLLALPAALADFNGFYERQGRFILSDPTHNLLAVALLAGVVMVLIAWGVRRAWIRAASHRRDRLDE